jgi:hypothetical protein
MNYYILFELPRKLPDTYSIDYGKYMQFTWFDIKLSRNTGHKLAQQAIFTEVNRKVSRRLSDYNTGKITFEQLQKSLIALRDKTVIKYPEHFQEVGWYDKKMNALPCADWGG